ncbi:MAG: di/tricarboxylate transporter [Candidatus Binatia bacterium]|jgi:di/tricarboxylate transporter
MTFEIATVFVIIALTFGAMVWEKLSVDVVAMLAFSALMALGILTPKEAFQVFGNPAVITIAGMFVISAALERTGVIDWIGERLRNVGGKSDLKLLLTTLPIVAVISAFMNNTPIVAVFMPLMITLAARRGLKPSKLLIPLSYAAIFGGCCTLIGTSTNIIVSSTAAELGLEPISMFEMTKIGAIMGVVGIVYLMTIGRRLLPDRETLASLLESTTSKQYLTEAVVVGGSPLIGKKLSETPLKSIPNSRILDVTRRAETLTTPLNEIELEQGDRLRLTTVVSSVMEINELKGVEILPNEHLGLEAIGMEKAVVVESVIGPDSEMIGKTLREINFRQKFSILVLALHRRGVNLRDNLAKVRLEFGDTILMQGSQTAISELKDNRSFLMLTELPESGVKRSKMWIPIAVLVGVVMLAAIPIPKALTTLLPVLGALDAMPIAALAVLGSVIVVATGCLKVEEAYRAIHWRIVFLILGMLSLGLAMSKTGGAELLANSLIGALQWAPESSRLMVMLALVYLLTNVLTEFLSNNAVAALVTPVVITAAIAVGAEPRPFIIAVALAASASFATPIGYQTNTLVYGAGGYLFRDFFKVGLPLNLLFWVMAVVLIPYFWPLQMVK